MKPKKGHKYKLIIDSSTNVVVLVGSDGEKPSDPNVGETLITMHA